jgi:hypothetical protein
VRLVFIDEVRRSIITTVLHQYNITTSHNHRSKAVHAADLSNKRRSVAEKMASNGSPLHTGAVVVSTSILESKGLFPVVPMKEAGGERKYDVSA